jgi:hypothetical protein
VALLLALGKATLARRSEAQPSTLPRDEQRLSRSGDFETKDVTGGASRRAGTPAMDPERPRMRRLPTPRLSSLARQRKPRRGRARP